MIKRILLYGLAVVLLLNFKAGAHASKSDVITPARIDSLNENAYKKIHSNIATAMVMLTDAEQMCIKTNYTKGLAVNYLYQAEVFNQRGYSKRAQVLYNHAIELSRQNNDLYNIARAEEHLSTIQRKFGNMDEAENLLNKSLAILKRLNKQIEIVNLKLRMGLLKEAQKKYPEALAIYDDACAEAKRIKFQYGEKKSYFNRAELYADINGADSAIIYYNKALRVDTLTKDQYGKALSYIGLSNVSLKQRQLKKTISYANAAQLNADSVHAYKLMVEALEILVKAANLQHDLASVTKWQQRLLEVERINSEANRNDAVLFVEVLKQQQERQLAIQQEISGIQKESQTKSIILLCILIVMLIVVLLVFSVSYNYKKAKLYAAELNEKNEQIKEHANSLDRLNKQILGQNTILEEDNSLKNKLLSIISHDLRHPLTNTKSIIDLINLNLVSNQEAGHLFHHLEAQYTRAVSLLDNLLYWIKSQVHDGRIIKQEVNLRHMISSLIEEQKLSLQKKEIQAVNLVEPEFELYAELEVLKIIFRNLLSNAVKFTNRYGAVVFEAEATGAEIKISVKDNGTGMNATTLSRIQGLSNYTSKGTADEDGSGMGLMLIRDLIKKINGSLTIESSYGEGSVFTVALAIVSEPVLHQEQ
ncbi:tetratricopeptide repeat-containing sensor histidine kinase [Mucilaginibacter agri]|uniref:histidine kinase n=1 Tax=Mucilaginibacter agri TaxID=2695265 RepID=A0A965ZFQ6_9SPHI|nr:ATP-binding protein [Mucilaginibacter agri]NCD70080.1 hypothetical protein [Mucilaginibacter agri]